MVARPFRFGSPVAAATILSLQLGLPIAWQVSAAQVSVTPDNEARTALANTSGQTVPFTIRHLGSSNQTYWLFCFPTGSITSCTPSQTSLTIPPQMNIPISATFTTGAAGTGVINMKACSNAQCTGSQDYGSYNVTVGVQDPTVSLARYHDAIRPADPFDVVHTVTSPAYQSRDEPRALTLQYNSSTVRPTPVISVDVTTLAAPYNPSVYMMQVKRTSPPTFLTLLNGTNTVYYTAPATSTSSRLVAAIDAKTNNLTTGWYDVDVSVIAQYSGYTKTTTKSTRLFVIDDSSSIFGVGWSLAGMQRLYTMTGSYSALISNGDGSLSFFKRICDGCPFISPAGDPTKLAIYTGPDTGITYRRTAPDSSATDFRSDGRMVRLWSGTLQRPLVILNWNGTQLTSVQDVIGKRLTLGYTGPASPSGKLQTITDPSGRVTTVWTDSAGRLYRVTDPDSLISTFSYDASFRLVGVTDRAGTTANLTYDALNRIDSTKSPSIIDYVGNSGRPTAVITAPERLAWQPAIAGTSTATAKAHVRTDTLSARVVDPVGNVTRFAYDRFATITKTIDPVGQVTTIQRDTLGQPTLVVSPNGHKTTATYSGYLLSSTYDSTTGQRVNYSHNGFARVITITGNAKTPRTDIYYKPAYTGSGDFGLVDKIYIGNTGSYASPTGGYIAASFVYDALGRDSVITDGNGHKATFIYADTAAFGNLVQVTDPFARVTSRAHHDVAGRTDTIWTPSNGSLAPSVYVYDQLNRVRSFKDPLGLTTQYAYGPITLDRITDAKGQIFRFDYNALGWNTTIRDLADTSKADTLKYDLAGRVRTMKTRRGDVISLTYDALGRILTRSGPDFPVDSFRYDPAGRWQVAVNANAYDSLAYSTAGRLVYSLERLTDDTSYVMTFTYDTLGRLVQRSAPRAGSVVTHGYHQTKGTLDTLCAASACSVWTSRDADDIAHVQKFGTNTASPWQVSFAFDSAHRIVGDSFQGTSVQHLNNEFAKRWSYDTLGRMIAEVPYGSTYGFFGYRYHYDAGGQLINACADSTMVIWGGMPPQPIGYDFSCVDEYGQETWTGVNPYRYDSTGNRTDPLASAVVGNGNRLTQFKGYAIAYDLNGNIISKKGMGGSWPVDTTLFTWDAAGALTRVERWSAGGAHTVITYAYDALGRRVSRTVGAVTERYVHEGDRVVQEMVGAPSSLKAEYGWAPGGGEKLLYVRTPTWTAGVITDPVNSTVRGLALANGGQTKKQYDASYWGVVPVDTGFVMHFRHSGREYDPQAGLYYNRARHYDPVIGRFLSEDPIGPAGGINQYTYVGNDPVNGLDPLGLDHEPCEPPPPPPPPPDPCGGRPCIPTSAAVEASDVSDDCDPPPPNCVYGQNADGCLPPMDQRGGGGPPQIVQPPPPSPRGPCILGTGGGTVVADRSIAMKLQAFINAGNQATGTKVVSSVRTSAKQLAMWWEFTYGRDGRSKYRMVGFRSCHQAGFCVDLTWNGLSARDRRVLDQLGSQYGFKRLEGDGGHYFYAPNGKSASYGPYADLQAAIDATQGALQRHEVRACR
jgi:RHS repeat-associated protein